MYFDTVLCSIKVWDGKAWITMMQWDKVPDPIVLQEKMRDIIIATPEDRWRDIE